MDSEAREQEFEAALDALIPDAQANIERTRASPEYVAGKIAMMVWFIGRIQRARIARMKRGGQ